MDVFERLGLGKLIDSILGQRDASWNSFQYSEVIETLFCTYLCGGDCLEDIDMLSPQLSLRPGTRIPSPDTVGRVLKSLATENISYACEKSGNSYSEKNFDIQNNDFGWAHLPFSFMNENMVFMMITAMLKNFFLYLTQNLSEKVKAIKKTSRLKKVLLHFICVPAKWIKSGRSYILKMYTERQYYKEVFCT